MHILRKASLWAYDKPCMTQIFIVFFNLAFAVLAWQTAIDLFAAGIKIPVAVYYAGIGLFLLCFACYPIRRARYRFWKPNYVRQKILDIGLILGYLMIVLTWTNVRAFQAYHHTEGAAQAEFIVLQGGKADERSTAETIFSRKTMRKKFKKYVRAAKKKNQKPNGFLLFLRSLLMLGLFISTVLFSCGALCSGGNGLFVLAALGSGALFTVLFIQGLKMKAGRKKSRYKRAAD